jgi:hypothetical protein
MPDLCPLSSVSSDMLVNGGLVQCARCQGASILPDAIRRAHNIYLEIASEANLVRRSQCVRSAILLDAAGRIILTSG